MFVTTAVSTSECATPFVFSPPDGGTRFVIHVGGILHGVDSQKMVIVRFTAMVTPNLLFLLLSAPNCKVYRNGNPKFHPRNAPPHRRHVMKSPHTNFVTLKVKAVKAFLCAPNNVCGSCRPAPVIPTLSTR